MKNKLFVFTILLVKDKQQFSLWHADSFFLEIHIISLSRI